MAVTSGITQADQLRHSTLNIKSMIDYKHNTKMMHLYGIVAMTLMLAAQEMGYASYQ
jgi:hypothetical protein